MIAASAGADLGAQITELDHDRADRVPPVRTQRSSASRRGCPRSPRTVVLFSGAATSVEVQVGAADCGRLLELLGQVPDPRRRRGIRHQLPGVLAVAAAAVLAGSRSVLAIAEWAAEAPQPVLAALGARRDARTGHWRAPSEDTFRRLLAAVNAEAVDRVIGIFLAERTGPASLGGGQPSAQQESGRESAAVAVAVDGKTLRGAIQADGRAAHLLAAMTHSEGVVRFSAKWATRPTKSPRSGHFWIRWTWPTR